MNPLDIRKKAEELGLPCIIPIVKVLKNQSVVHPTDLYARLRSSSEKSFLLESAELGEKTARYTYVGSDPDKTITLHKAILNIEGGQIRTDQPLEYLKDMITRYNISDEGMPKFFGGLLGYLAYDAVRYIESIDDSTADDLGHEDAYFFFVKDLFVFDHWREEVLIISNMVIENSEDIASEYEKAHSTLKGMEDIFKTTMPATIHFNDVPEDIEMNSNFTKENFKKAVLHAKEHIYKGDIFQVVLSQRFVTEGSFDPFTVYMALKEINPSPYMYLLDLGVRQIIGSSPEILVKVDDRVVTVRPIAGTRPRGSDIVEDEALAREMVNDEKERAEHVMLVDLGRNDVGKVARFGTVEVTEFFGVEKYSHVQHIISNVKGKLENGVTSFDALMAAFPAGTVTGTPKIRAMEIIDELEPTRRGIYAGSVGAFCFNQNMDFAITIRTIVLEKDRAYVQSGAGIVADSIPENEHLETLNKGKAMVKALEKAGRNPA